MSFDYEGLARQVNALFWRGAMLDARASACKAREALFRKEANYEFVSEFIEPEQMITSSLTHISIYVERNMPRVVASSASVIGMFTNMLNAFRLLAMTVRDCIWVRQYDEHSKWDSLYWNI